MRNGVGIGTLSCVCADGVYTLNGNSQIVKEINRRVAEKVGYRNAHIVIKAVVNVRNNGNTVGCVFSELTFNVESADAVNLVAKEIETERHLIGKRENVDNASANRVLAGLINKINSLKTVLVEQIDQKIVRQRIAFAHHKSVGCKPVGRDDFFHHCLGIGDNNHRALRRSHLAQHIGTQKDVAAVGALVVHRPLIRRRHIFHIGLAQHGLQVVVEIGG